MALSMDEQRVLAEIERRLAAEEPRLAASLTSFRRPGPAAVLRAPRKRIIGSVFTVVVVAMISLMVYAIIPFRGHSARTPAEPGQAATTASANGPGTAKFSVAPGAGTSANAVARANAATGASAQANAKATAGATLKSGKSGSGAAAHGKAASAKAASGSTGSPGSGSSGSGTAASSSAASGSATSDGMQVTKPKTTGSSVP
jgi:hypothetical protein